MKLYAHPVSTTSRPIMMFCAEQGVDIEFVTVDLLSGAHKQADYLAVNPNGMVPAIEDDGFVLSESSAILKYLADKIDSPTYPKDPKARARINEIMDWFNTNFYRDIAYNVVYPQVFPNHARATDALTQSVIDWGLERLRPQLETLDRGWHTFPGGSAYLTGADITIADYLGADLLACGDLIGTDWSVYPNVARWLDTMKARPAWDEVHQVVNGFAASLADREFSSIA
jgi:glutathione S-transferase